MLAYRSDDPYTSYVAFTGIGNSKLKMYIMPSDDNPFDDADFGRIRAHNIEAEEPSWEARLVFLGVGLLLLLVL